jgi:sulfur-carrier protein
MTITVLYFASLREARGIERETLPSHDGDLGALYDALATTHGFALKRDRVRVAVNGEFVSWQRAPVSGDEVVFIPPVSGG